MYAFIHQRPASLEEAAGLLRQLPEAKLLAGGQTLIPTLKARLARPSHLIDLGGLGALREVALRGDVLCIGAMATHAQVADSAVVRQAIPGLAQLAARIGDPQVRSLGTLGGSLANNDPAADYPAAVLGLGASIVTHRRSIAADDFFLGMFSTSLEADELILRVDFPLPRASAYAKFDHPASGFAMAGVFVARTGAGVRVAVTGAGEAGVFQWQACEQALAIDFSTASIDGLKPDTALCMADLHGPAAYRAQLVAVMAARAVEQLRPHESGT